MKTVHTPECEGSEAEYLRVKDRNRCIGSVEFAYLRCERCGLIRLENVPVDLGDYYPDEYYALPSIGRLDSIASSDPSKIETIQRFVRQGRMLEIGPAFGVFAYQAKRAGFLVDAIEMDERCCDHLRRVVGVNAVCSTSPHEAISALGAHDVVALWHVIEHLPDPWALLREAATNLVCGGILVLAAPNPEAWQFHVMGKDWPHIDAPRHLYLLPAQTLIDYVQTLGLECLYYTTTDSDAKSWNRFGWQRLLMNRTRGKWLGRAAFVVGYILSHVLAYFESGEFRGSSYTLVFRKTRE